ncbi:unnamed protein product [Symbiodinium microadriaticum]|nr:unnamed protein product [Symbiodinium microadriaticum]
MLEEASNHLPDEGLMESRQRAPRSVFAVGAASLLLMACLLAPKSALTLFGFNSGLISVEDVRLPTLPTLPASPADELQDTVASLKQRYGFDGQRRDEIALCIINLNLGFWKLVQWSTILTEATNNCPAGFHDPDKKLACQINMAAVFAPLSASIGLFSSTAFLCPGKMNPDAACASTFGATFEAAAKFAASPAQISLFCPKAVAQRDFAEGGQTVFQNERRLGNSSHGQPTEAEARKLYVVIRNATEPDSTKLKNTFCTWQIAQSILFAMRAGPLIEISTRLCPPPRGGEADCSQVINEIMLMFWNVGKFIAAAATNCITGLNVAAGCALGSLNLVSAFSATGSVTSALVSGVCTDLQGRKRNITEQRINRKIQRIKLLQSISLRRLLREKKLTGSAEREAEALVSLPNPRSNATMPELLKSIGLHAETASHPRELVLSHLRSLKPNGLEESERREMFATARALLAKHESSWPVPAFHGSEHRSGLHK